MTPPPLLMAIDLEITFHSAPFILYRRWFIITLIVVDTRKNHFMFVISIFIIAPPSKYS